MSNIFQSQALEKDFANFEKALLKTNKFKFGITEQTKPYLRKYHRLTYIIALLKNKIESKWTEGNKFLFVNEILSDLLINSSICFLGFVFASNIILRRLIENFYHHVFYFEHPVEFELLNLGRNEYTPIVELKNYFEAHPVVRNLSDSNIKIFSDQLFQHYQELCRTAHTKGEGFMGLAENLEGIKPEFDLVNHFEMTNRSLQSIVYLLYKFHRDLILTNTEVDVIAKSFPKNLRGMLLS